jgi:hypothetical protein
MDDGQRYRDIDRSESTDEFDIDRVRENEECGDPSVRGHPRPSATDPRHTHCGAFRNRSTIHWALLSGESANQSLRYNTSIALLLIDNPDRNISEKDNRVCIIKA